jgi:ribosomal-protein-alanine N-acetyltransferase
MILQSERCLLRPYRAADVEWLPDLANDIEVARWTSASFPHPYTAADAELWTKRASNEYPVDSFVIEAAGTPVGGAGLRFGTGEGRGVAECGYWLGRRFWGRGYATDATRLLVRYAFGTREVRRLEGYVFAANPTSGRVLEKCGFSREAVLREALTDRDGIVMDAWLYARLRSDP